VNRPIIYPTRGGVGENRGSERFDLRDTVRNLPLVIPDFLSDFFFVDVDTWSPFAVFARVIIPE
jgi:hypothetical protein